MAKFGNSRKTRKANALFIASIVRGALDQPMFRPPWRRVFKTLHGYGDWLQLSMFQWRLTARRRVELEIRIRGLVKAGDDHVLLIHVGPADKVEIAVESIGKTFENLRAWRSLE